MVTRWAAVPLAGNRKRVFKDNERDEPRQMKTVISVCFSLFFSLSLLHEDRSRLRIKNI